MIHLFPELQPELDAARQRLGVGQLSDAELVERLREAQQHSPVTGYMADAAGAVVLREELTRRRTSDEPEAS